MKVRLPFTEKLRIVDWLRANREDLMRRKDDYEVVAARAGRELNLNVTLCGLRGLLKDLDMLWFRTGERGLGKKTIAKIAPVEPAEPIAPIAPIVKQADLFLDIDGAIVGGETNGAPVKDFDLRTLESFQSQLNSLRNKVATLASRLANAQETVAKASAETVSKLDARITAIEKAMGNLLILEEFQQRTDARITAIEEAFTKPRV